MFSAIFRQSTADPGNRLAEKAEIQFTGIVVSLVLEYFFIGEIIYILLLLSGSFTLRFKVLDCYERSSKSSYLISPTASIP